MIHSLTHPEFLHGPIAILCLGIWMWFQPISCLPGFFPCFVLFWMVHTCSEGIYRTDNHMRYIKKIMCWPMMMWRNQSALCSLYSLPEGPSSKCSTRIHAFKNAELAESMLYLINKWLPKKGEESGSESGGSEITV